MLGYSALFQGKPDPADRFFDEAVSVDVPDRTDSVNKPIEARSRLSPGEPVGGVPDPARLRPKSGRPITRIWRERRRRVHQRDGNDRPSPGRGPRATTCGRQATSVPSLPEPSSPMPQPGSPPVRNASLTTIGRPNRGSTLGTR